MSDDVDPGGQGYGDEVLLGQVEPASLSGVPGVWGGRLQDGVGVGYVGEPGSVVGDGGVLGAGTLDFDPADVGLVLDVPVP